MEKATVSKKYRTSLYDSNFDVVRITDPGKKEIVSLEVFTDELEDSSCFFEIEDNPEIKNANEKKAVIDIRRIGSCIYMVTTAPLTMNKRRYKMELFKNLSASYENAKIEAVKDYLTDLYNRRYIDERLPLDMIKSKHLKMPLSLILVDIDFFKNINDTYGHVAGDFMLKEIAGLLRSSIRSSQDWLARYGGEEFLICLNGANLDIACNVAEKLRHITQSRIFIYKGARIRLTASFGVASTDCLINPTPEKLISLVDEKLYHAKRNGRNIVAS